MAKIHKIALLLAITASIGFYIGLSTQPILQEQLPWYISRSSAIVAYLLCFAVIAWGFGMTTGLSYKITNPVKAWTIHKYMGIALGVIVAVHALSLLFDKFINFGILDILIPFSSDYKPVFLSLGIIGFYFLMATIFASVFLRVKSPKFWRASHYFTYPLFALGLFHGLFIGTDSKTPAMQAVYWITGAIFTGIVFYRIFYAGKQVKA